MMVELGVRIVLALLIGAAGLALGKPPAQTALEIALVYLLASCGVFILDRAKRRNAGIAGFVAVMDATFIAVSLAACGQLDHYGFLVLAPMMWATGRYSSDAAAMAPLCAATVMVSSNFFGGGGFTLPVMFHTLGILAVGLLTNQAKVVVKERNIPVEITRNVEVESEESIRMRETYASLKSHISDLEESTKRERLGMKLWMAANQSEEAPIPAMAAKLREDTGLEGVVLYTLDPRERRFVVGAVSGEVPAKVRDSALAIGKGLSEAQMADRLTRQLTDLRDSDRAVKVKTLVIKDQGKPNGCIALFDPQHLSVEEAVSATKPVMDYLGGLVSQVKKKEDENRRLREAEVLYGVASVSIGAESRQGLISRVLREIGETIAADHLAAYLVEGQEAIPVSTIGSANRLMENLSFAYGGGLSGWLATGTPEVVASDALDDDRIDRVSALKNRVGSFALLPIETGDGAIGFVTAATHRVGGIDAAKIESLRAIVAELGQALLRNSQGGSDPLGAMTPKEFYDAVRQGGEGHFVYFDVTNREILTRDFGRPALDAAMRKLTHRLRTRLPAKGGMCRREEGDFVAYLAGESDEAAQKWANESAAALNGLNLTTPDGRHRINLQIRAKVAPFAPQKSQVSKPRAA